MSSLLGGPGARLSLSRAVDELTASARWAGRPGLVWIAGVCYPSLLANLDVVQSLVLAFEKVIGRDLGLSFFADDMLRLPLLPFVSVSDAASMIALSIVMILPALLVYRLNVGLAAIAAPDAEFAREPRTLRAAWRAGKGEGRAALGMWLALMGLLIGVLAFLFGPTLLIVRLLSVEGVPALVTLLAAPTVLLVLGYGSVLLVLHMLALQSLAQNRRGVASALTHAWRLVRAEPWGAVRACVVDITLQMLLVVALVVADTALRMTVVGVAFSGLVYLALLGVAGVTRAAFWSRVYRALGGPLRTDGMPGLRHPVPESSATVRPAAGAPRTGGA